MILIFCNELQSIENARNLNTDYFKILITDYYCTIESKYMNPRTIDNVSNFIFVSNNVLPIKIENGDRLILFLKLVMKGKINSIILINSLRDLLILFIKICLLILN
jgi:hypothetical protein